VGGLGPGGLGTGGLGVGSLGGRGLGGIVPTNDILNNVAIRNIVSNIARYV